jgi:hypothetical protein
MHRNILLCVSFIYNKISTSSFISLFLRRITAKKTHILTNNSFQGSFQTFHVPLIFLFVHIVSVSPMQAYSFISKSFFSASIRNTFCQQQTFCCFYKNPKLFERRNHLRAYSTGNFLIKVHIHSSIKPKKHFWFLFSKDFNFSKQ